MVENWVLKFSIFFLCAACDPKRESREKVETTFGEARKSRKKIAMEKDSGLIRRRITRTARESTPEPTVKERVSKISDRETKTQSQESVAAVDDAKYIVRGILNVGPPSPAGSSSSSGSGSGGYGATSGSQAYRAKILRYFGWDFEVGKVDWDEKFYALKSTPARRGSLLMMSCWW